MGMNRYLGEPSAAKGRRAGPPPARAPTQRSTASICLLHPLRAPDSAPRHHSYRALLLASLAGLGCFKDTHKLSDPAVQQDTLNGSLCRNFTLLVMSHSGISGAVSHGRDVSGCENIINSEHDRARQRSDHDSAHCICQFGVSTTEISDHDLCRAHCIYQFGVVQAISRMLHWNWRWKRGVTC